MFSLQALSISLLYVSSFVCASPQYDYDNGGYSDKPTPYGPPAPHIPITGPVINQNFPDPSFIKDNGVWYAFGTETVNKLPRIHVASSNDFIHWTVHEDRDGLARLPTWANTTTYRNVWAPDLSREDDGTFVMYFSALLNNTDDFHCIGVARSKTAIGPYTPRDTPVLCPKAADVIDASIFKEHSTGQRYISYKYDIEGTPLRIQKLSTDGNSAVGPATTMLTNRGNIDGDNIEAPLIVKDFDDGTYFLFFSSGNFYENTYDVSYATSKNVLGPYTRVGKAVTYKSSGIRGPGHMDVNPLGTRMVFHGLIDHAEPIPNRGMWVASVVLKNGTATVG